jgi:hypothetical protein
MKIQDLLKTNLNTNQLRRYIHGGITFALFAWSLWTLPEALRAHTAKPFTRLIASVTLIVAYLLSIWTIPQKLNWVFWIVTVAWFIFVFLY